MSNEHFDVLALDEDEEMEKQCDSAQSPEHSSQGEGGGEDDLAEMQDGAHLEAAVDDQGRAAEQSRPVEDGAGSQLSPPPAAGSSSQAQAICEPPPAPAAAQPPDMGQVATPVTVQRTEWREQRLGATPTPDRTCSIGGGTDHDLDTQRLEGLPQQESFGAESPSQLSSHKSQGCAGSRARKPSFKLCDSDSDLD